MHVGLFLALANPFTTPEVLRAIGTRAEERGVHELWVPEHVVLFDDYQSRYPYADDGRMPGFPGSGMLEPFTALTYLAACTERVRLATGVLLLPQRNPVYTAKEAAAVDYLSGGRLDLGIGVGWQREEYEALNVPFAHRGARADDYLGVLQALWCDDPSEFHGAFYDLPPSSLFPKPVQQPHPPIIVGGESDAALRRVAAAGQGWHTFNRLPGDLPEALTRLDAALAERGRSRDEISVVASPYFNGLTTEMVEQFAELGVDQVTSLFFATSLDEVERLLDELQPCLDRAAALL